MRHVKYLFSTLILLLCSVAASAHDYFRDGIYYNYYINGEVEVTYYGDHWAQSYTEYRDNVVIPDRTSWGDRVVAIGKDAFNECRELKSVSIPSSVTIIGDYSFRLCSNLTSIIIPENVTSIGEAAFGGCEKLHVVINHSKMSFSAGSGDYGYIAYYAKKVVNVNELITIDDYQFYTSNGEYYLVNYIGESKNIILPNSCNGANYNIANGAFYGCANLESITIPSGVTAIGNSAFYGCSNLVSITIPNSVTSIGKEAFYGCCSLSTMTIPSGVTSIEDAVFYGCNNLNSITIPNSVTSIGKEAFYGCAMIESVTIPSGVTSIKDAVFRNCNNLASITIPSSVTSIGEAAFRNCGLESITIPNGVTSIDREAFYSCDSLTSITIPQTVTNIGTDAFYGCYRVMNIHIGSIESWLNIKYGNNSSRPNYGTYSNIDVKLYIDDISLTEVEIPSVITAIPEYAFYRCKSLTSIILSESVDSIGESAFSGCSNLVSITIPDNSQMTSIGERAFQNCSSLIAINIPESLTSIGEIAFYGCSSLTNITISENSQLTSIGEQAFQNCSSLTAFTIPENVNSIGMYTFSGCGRLTTIAVTENSQLASIDKYAFYNCSSLTAIIIPEKVNSIGENAFFGCDSLRTVIVKATVPPTLFSSIFKTSPITVVVPRGIADKYQATVYWNELNIIEEYYILTYIVDGEAVHSDSVAYGTTIVPLKEPTREEHTFSGWSEIPETMPAKDVTVTGSFTVNRYKITYAIDGIEYSTDSVAYGTTLTTIAAPTKEGYTFSGWSEVPTTMPAKDVTVTGTFCINTYKLAYTVDGEIYHTDSIIYGTALTAMVEPVKEGYTFSGWSEVPETMPANDVTVTGLFTINSYQLTYTLDGEVYYTDSIIYATSITPLAEPAKEGYTFSGWSGLPESMPAKDVTVTGLFTVNKYLVTFKIGDEVISSDSLEYGSTIVVPAAPDKVGYTFDGWGEVAETVPAIDLTYVSRYSVDSYLLTYTVDGETFHTGSIAYGTSLTAIAAPVKEGHTFSGWIGLPETMPAKDVTVTGSFTVNRYKITYAIDGIEHSTDSVAYGTTLTTIAAPTKEGCTFSGWSEVPATMPAKDVTVTGTFCINTYKLAYTVDGEIYHTDSIIYGTALTAMAEPVKEGYTFSGWSEVPETMPANDVTVTGLFTINSYQLTYTLDGEVYYTDSIIYATSITPLAEPAKEGYTFSGWSELPATMPAEDVIISGEFILNRTQNDAQGLVYELSMNGEAYEVANYTSVLVDNLVIPSELYGMPVRTLRDRALMGADELKSIVIPESVTTVGDRTFYSCHELLVIEWNAKAAVNAACFDKPEQYGNMLVFVADAATKVSYQGNVIVGDVADEIVLTDGLPLRNPREFTARHITFTHNFSKKTKIGVSGGWEAMVLPFDVQRVVSETKGELKPFGEADFETSLPYWLGELQADGTFAAVQNITANKPFIMQLPNSDEYEDIYNVEGKVTFSAEEVTVHATTDAEQEQGKGYALLGSYEGTESYNNIYALNDEEYTAGGDTYMPGSVFVAGSRAIRPFEAYIYSASANRAPYLRIGGKGGTGINELTIDNGQLIIYDLMGRKVLNTESLKGGIYIVNGKKVVIE